MCKKAFSLAPPSRRGALNRGAREGLPSMEPGQVQEICICEACPTYAGGDKPIGYCVTGKSRKITSEVSCICTGCPAYAALRLSRMFYCTRGTEPAQKKKK